MAKEHTIKIHFKIIVDGDTDGTIYQAEAIVRDPHRLNIPLAELADRVAVILKETVTIEKEAI